MLSDLFQVQKRERVRERKSSATKIERSSKVSIAKIVRRDHPPKSSAEIVRSTVPIVITQSVNRDRGNHHADCDLAFASIVIGAVLRAIAAPRRTQKMFVFLYLIGMFVFLCFFVFLLFGNRENVRKCEQQVENVFSMVFSRTPPNIRKYFSKHFLKCNQIHENIFLFGK